MTIFNSKSVFGVSFTFILHPSLLNSNEAPVIIGMTSIYDVDEEPKNIVFRAFFMVVWDCILEV